MRERYVCDRNGGEKANYLRRRPWDCPCCGHTMHNNGHICQDCHRRVCCGCFHHDIGACITAAGSDVPPCGKSLALLKAPCPGLKVGRGKWVRA